MRNDIDEMNKLRNQMKLLMALIIMALAASVLKNIINERWAKQRDTVACVPQVETNYPGIYLESAAHPINHDAKMKLFVEQYIHLTQDEAPIDFHKTTKDKRLDKARLSDNKYKAIFMSDGPERILNQTRFSVSNERFVELDRDKKSIVFLIDEILITPVPMSNIVPVTVRGQYEGLFDTEESKNKGLAPEFLGYKEIKLLVRTDFPETNLDDTKFYNKPGFFVIWSEMTELDIGTKTKLEQRSREMLLRN